MQAGKVTGTSSMHLVTVVPDVREMIAVFMLTFMFCSSAMIPSILSVRFELRCSCKSHWSMVDLGLDDFVYENTRNR